MKRYLLSVAAGYLPVLPVSGATVLNFRGARPSAIPDEERPTILNYLVK